MTIDIQELKKMAQKATQGKWEWWTSNSKLRLTGGTARDRKDGNVLDAYDFTISCSLENQRFIESCNPEKVLALIERIENLETTVKFFETLTRDQQDKLEELEGYVDHLKINMKNREDEIKYWRDKRNSELMEIEKSYMAVVMQEGRLLARMAALQNPRRIIPCVAMDGSNPFEQKSQYSHAQYKSESVQYYGITSGMNQDLNLNQLIEKDHQ